MRGSFFDYLVALIVSFIIGTLVLLLLFHFRLFNGINVLMYRGLVYIALVSIIMLEILLIIAVLSKKLMARDAFNIVVIFACVHITFFTLVPVTVERSVSVFMLSQLDNDLDRKMTKQEIEKTFLDKYVYENQAFEKRFNEQITTGTIEKVGNDTYKLTKKGRSIVSMFDIIGQIYGVDMKNMR